MFRRILVPLEHTATDETILSYIRPLARECRSKLVLIHVADGWVARNIQPLELRESEEMKDDRTYLQQLCATLQAEGFACEAVFAAGEPAKEIAAVADRERCDLIAMATHGHRGLNDLVLGSVASQLRHITMVPVLMVRVKKQEASRGNVEEKRLGGS